MSLYSGSNQVVAARAGHAKSTCLKIALCATLLAASSCVRYEPEPVDLNEVFDEWKKVDAAQADSSVHAAYAKKGNENQLGYNLSDGITLEEAEVTALFFNPSIRATRLQIGIPMTEAKYAKLWEDPGLNIDGEYVLDDVDDPLVLGAGLSITIPISGRSGMKKKLAEAKITEKEAAAIGAEWALINTLRQQWIAMAALQAEEALLTTAVSTLEKLSAASEKFRAAQAITTVELRLLQIQHKKAQAELKDVQIKLAEQRQVVIATMGLYPETNWNLLVTVPEIPVINEKQDLFVSAAKHPTTRIALAAYGISERQLAYEVRKQYPDLNIGFGAGTDQGESRLGFGLGLLPIPMWNSNKAGIASAKVERQLAAIQVEQSLKDLVNKIFFVRKQYASSLLRQDFYQNEIAPLSDKQLVDAKRLANLGQLDLFLLVDALEQSRENNVELLRLKMDVIRQAFELNALQAAPWSASVLLADESHFDTSNTKELTNE